MYRTIITHHYPDIDAVTGVWLLVRYGAEYFPQIGSAEIRLIPAGPVPADIIAEHDDEHRYVSVDTGRGEFDTHECQTDFGSSTMLVATRLGLADAPHLQALLRFVEGNDTRGSSPLPRDAVAQYFLLTNIIKGLHLIHDWRTPAVFPLLFAVLDRLTSYADLNPEMLEAYWQTGDGPTNERMLGLLERWWSTTSVKDRVEHGGCDLRTLLARPVPPAWLGKIALLTENGQLARFLLDRQAFAADYIAISLFGLLSAMAHDPDGVGPAEDCLATVLDGLFALEVEWQRLIESFGRGEGFMAFPFSLRGGRYTYNCVCVTHSSPLALRAVRASVKHAAIILAINEDSGAVSVTSAHNGPLAGLDFGRLAALYRCGEAVVNQSCRPPDLHTASAKGTQAGWYLHDTAHILQCGSLKSPVRQPTCMTASQLINLLAVFLDRDVPIAPSFGCPQHRCSKAKCPFYVLRLPLCGVIERNSGGPFLMLLIRQKAAAAVEKHLLPQGAA